MRYFRVKTNIDYVEWDMDTVTVSDFAAQFSIKEGMYGKFKKDFKEKLKNDSAAEGTLDDYSMIYEFELALIRTIESQLIKMPKVYKDLDNIEI